jgi:hypothetical protein
MPSLYRKYTRRPTLDMIEVVDKTDEQQSHSIGRVSSFFSFLLSSDPSRWP